jgi:hypothetical protein
MLFWLTVGALLLLGAVMVFLWRIRVWRDDRQDIDD